MMANEDSKTKSPSKRELKRLARRAVSIEQRKEKRKIQKARRKDAKSLNLAETVTKKKQPIFEMASGSRLSVAIDLSFDALMLDGELRKCVSQLGYCYAANRRCTRPLQLHFVEFNGSSRQLFDSMSTNKNWDVHLSEKPIEDQWSVDQIVYLSSESENVLQELDETKVYVIGGLVDHNRNKGICHQKAIAKGFGHARLPIDEFVDMKTRKVLTINHVFEILVRFTESGNWKSAFLSVIPQRKGAIERSSSSSPSPSSIVTNGKGEDDVN